VIDIGDEYVCKSCGMVVPKEVIGGVEDRAPQAVDYTKLALGGYLGPLEYGYEERFSPGFAKSNSTFRYLKMVSDYSGREDSSVYACAKMVERVCEKLGVPKIVVGQSMVIARKLFGIKGTGSKITVAAISAFSVITACKIEGVTSIGVKEVLAAHTILGHRVKISSLIQISLDSPVKIRARRPEEFLARVMMRISSDAGLKLAIRGRNMNERAYYDRLHEAARLVLSMVSEEMRGGHSPCALAATATYAAEVALAHVESRRRFLAQRDVAVSVDIAEYTVREQYGTIFRNSQRGFDDALRERSSLPQTIAK
jgi:transcription initiation factor TFIIIB Brf1 subunit/transcription initiation factor TFIIB